MTKKTCPVCGEGQLIEREQETTLVYKGLETTVLVPGQWCDACDDGILGPEGLRVRDVARAELRAKHQGVLGPQEVKRIREKLGLSQRMASDLLGGGAQSFQRYESGAVVVSEGMSNQLILLDKVSDLPESVREQLLAGLRADREALRAQRPQTAA